MNRINAPFELKDADQKGRFSGYLSIYDNVDLGNDVIVKGAFNKVKTTKDGKLRIAIYHDMQRFVGKADFSDDEKGFFVDVQLEMDVSYVPDQYKLIQAGILDGMSVGFDIVDGGYEIKDGIRYITDAELWEGSIVAFGMNPEAKIETVKTFNIKQLRKLEEIAKSNGCSSQEAVAISSIFKAHLSDSGLLDRQSDSDEAKEILAAVKAAFNKY